MERLELEVTLLRETLAQARDLALGLRLVHEAYLGRFFGKQIQIAQLDVFCLELLDLFVLDERVK